ncbi:MAG: hypothetical protein WBB52_16285 [Acidimicrobiales bacterium]|jgi:hypothetical protein
MRMRLPEGSSWFSSFVDRSQIDAGLSEHDIVEGVSVDVLQSALEAMQRGEVEFVIIEDGDEFVQAAGDGDGPYQLEHYAVDGTVTAAANAGYPAVASVFTSYLAGDGSWQKILGPPGGAEAPERSETSPQGPVEEGRGLLGRLFRR